MLFIRLKFGFKVEHKVHVMFTRIVEDMEKRREIDLFKPLPIAQKTWLSCGFQICNFKLKGID